MDHTPQHLTQAPRAPWLDAVWLGLLMAYVLAGAALVPLHGDEPTVIYTSRDYAYQFIQRDLSRLVYTPDPASLPDPDAATQQDLRLLNGTVTRYSIGLAWHLAGLTVEDVNQQWLWGAGWDYNRDNGHLPSEALLTLARTVSALMAALTVPAAYGVARLLWGDAVGGRAAAYALSAFIALHPVILLNGRRAMMEGALLLFTTLSVLAALAYLRADAGRRWAWALTLGVSVGLAVASKHPAALIALPLALGLGLVWLMEAAQQRRIPWRTLAQLTAAGGLSLGVFFVLNPAWWSDPLAVVAEVLRLRAELLSGQMAFFGAYPDAGAALSGAVTHLLSGVPQYYEAPQWADFIGAQITAYEASPWAGLRLPGGLAVGLGVGLAALGAWRLLHLDERRVQVLAAAWIAGTLSLVVLLTPLGWQRYYLPGLPAYGALIALGVGQLWLWLRARLARSA